MSSRQQWLDAGLATLAELGAPALTIDRLSGVLGLSKGSFYHHFGGMGGYRTALLEHFEDVTTRYITAVEERDSQPSSTLAELLELVIGDTGDDLNLETAVRAWAQQAPEVRAAQERVDQLRMEYLTGVWLAATGDKEEAERAGRLLYVILIGAGHVIRPVPAGELRNMYGLVLKLVGC